ncbi:MAG: helix-turn-helix transcriptional regulator [Gammaproteobacteria bacterium]
MASPIKPSHALAYLRQLCCSGLSREITIAEFLKSLPMLISSNSNIFTFYSEQLCPTYSITGFDVADLAPIIPSILNDFHSPQRQQRLLACFSRYPAISHPRAVDESFYMTDLYNLIYRQFDMHHFLFTRIPLDKASNGIVGLFRPRSQKPFESRDQAQLVCLVPYIAHAYRVEIDAFPEFSSDGTSGMMVMNTRGAVLYQSKDAKRLLEQARFPRLLAEMRQQDRLLAKLTELCRNLRGIHRGHELPPPSFSHIGPKGQFLFRAYWLEGYQQQSDGLIGISIEHREPLALKIIRAMRESPLSPMQKQVAQFLAQGFTQEQIGKRLHIKPTTVKDHIGKIYLKLDIHHRDELLPKLMSLSVSHTVTDGRGNINASIL